MREALSRPAKQSFFNAKEFLRLGDNLFLSLSEAGEGLAAGDEPQPTLQVAYKDLYCLMRSDVMLVDLSSPGYGEQGIEVLFGHIGRLPIVGLTDRFQTPPSILSRLDCLIAPTNTQQIVRAIQMYGKSVEVSSLVRNAQHTNEQKNVSEPLQEIGVENDETEPKL